MAINLIQLQSQIIIPNKNKTIKQHLSLLFCNDLKPPSTTPLTNTNRKKPNTLNVYKHML